MMLWDIIREFFVKYVFGGVIYIDGNPTYFTPNIGCLITEDAENLAYGVGDTANVFIKLPIFDDANYGVGYTTYITVGDYLSTTATIIVMVLLCILLVKLAIWIFKLGANLIRLR